MGKPIGAAIAEAEKCALGLPLLRRARRGASSPTSRSSVGGARAYVRYQPLGPVLAIMPWNFPFWQVFRFAAPALMAGNVGLLKHASNVPQCALAIEEIFRARRLPGGRLPDAADRLRATWRAIIDDPRVAAVTLTGSEAGRQRGRRRGAGSGSRRPCSSWAAATRSSSCRSADLDARGRDRGEGAHHQQRPVLHRRQALHRRTRPSTTSSSERFVAGDGGAQGRRPDGRETAGRPAGHRGDPRRRRRAGAATRSRRARGSWPAARRSDGPGNFYAPTVLADVPAGSPARRRGAVRPGRAALPRRATSTTRSALANALALRPRAPAPGPPTRAEQERFIDEIEAGMVVRQRHGRLRSAAAVRRREASGYGRELARDGIREFVNVKTVWIEGAAGGDMVVTE